MSHLIFEEILILSKVEKKARKIQFSPQTNVVIGENDVGKSTLIKSLYYTLGAAPPKLDNSRWEDANPIYLLKFIINNNRYQILRDEDYFGVFNDDGKLLGQYKGISREGGISDAINPLLNFNVELESAQERMQRLGPAFYFIPFYIDQDDGWNKIWASFTGLQSIKKYRSKMLDYHLGIRSQSYYDALKTHFLLSEENNQLSIKKSSLIDVRESFKNKNHSRDFEIDTELFKKDIEELVSTYNQIHNEQLIKISLIKKVRNDKLSLQNEIDILQASIKEIEADYVYCESPSTHDVIDCPTCGTEFKNSVVERFGILDDIDYCITLIEQKQKELLLTEEQISKLDREYKLIREKMKSVENLLERKKTDVTFSDIISSQGYKEVIKSIGEDISSIDNRQADVEAETEILKKDRLKLDVELKKEITAFYQQKMKESLNKLDVQVLSSEDYDSIEKTITANTLGSDLPRALLAQSLSLLHTMKKYNKFILCPLVIDSPIQQEQDSANEASIFDFIFKEKLPEQQLILGTLEIEGKIDASNIPKSYNKIMLDKKYGLLVADEYESILKEILPLQELTLSVGKA